MTDARRQTAEALHEQRDWLRVTLSSIGDAVITTDNEGRITFLNPVAESLTGWTQDAANGKPLETVFKIVNQDTRKTVESPTVRALRDGVIVGLANHTLLISKDGTERPIDDSAAPIRNERNEVAGVVLVFRDITERYRQEQAVRFLASIVESTDDAIISKSLDGMIQSWNAAAERLFGYTAEQAVGRHISFLIPADRISEEDRIIARLRAGERVDHFETVRLRSDGQPIHVSLTLSPIRDESGRVIGASKIVRDITDRKRAEAAVSLSEVRYRRLFETAKDGILILDFNTGRVTEANPFMCELLCYSRDEFLGKELWEIGLFSDRSASEAAVRELQEKSYIRYEDLPLETKRGKRVEVEIVANAYKEDHKPVIQCNIRDITERVRMERKVKEQAEALADLHRRKDEFLAMLSHELRNPLAPISNAVQLLRLQGDGDRLQHSARSIIERQVGQMKHLIDDLLEVSRITTGRVQLHQERIAVAGVVEQAVETARPLVEQHRHELTVTVPPQPIMLYADAARLEQVVVNLLTNAAKYTNDGGHIWLSVQQEGDEAVLRVRDTGVGIAPELLPRIFDLFTQAERSLARSEGGLGIGLSLVHRLVELHRGRVEAHSSLGRGSEFVVRLPVVLTPAPPSTPAAIGVTKTTGPSLRILVVDDNVDAAESLADLLRALRHDVRTAHDGPTALTAADEYRPDMVLLDIGLPKMNGHEVAKTLRQRSALKNIVLVAMTGYGQESDREQSKEAGFDHHLVKPADFGKVQSILATVSRKESESADQPPTAS